MNRLLTILILSILTLLSSFAQKPKSSVQSEAIKPGMVAVKLDSNVNSVYTEIGPLPSPDGKTLYFSRRGDPNDVGGERDLEDIWYSEWNPVTKKWGPAKNMGAPLNNRQPNFISSISPDGNTILLGNSYFEDGHMEDGVSISRRTASGWSFPQQLDINIDNISEMTDFYLSNSQTVLIMSVQRKGDTYGDRDLYVSFLESDSIWTDPLNLGKTVNTSGIEMAPFLASDDKTLYYATTGLPGGYGGSDIYVVRRLDDTWQNWSAPENMGSTINTKGDDAYLAITAAGDKVYFTSGASENTDMYTLALPKVAKPSPVTLINGRVLNSKTNEPVPGAKIYFENVTNGTSVGIATSNPTSGAYQIILPSGTQYGYLAQKPGFVSVHANLDVTSQKEYTEIYQDLYLTPIEAGQTIAINNVFFDFDKYELKKGSYFELDRIVKLLQDNPTMKIEVSGNADSKGTAAYNDVLSQKRAQAVANYLISKSGSEASRIVVKSYGETKPVASNKTEKGRQLNRRVEFKILNM